MEDKGEDKVNRETALQAEIAAQLEPGETLLASFASDLDQDLRFADNLVALTNRRLLILYRSGPAKGQWQSWPLAEVVTMRAADRAGLGTFEVLGSAGRLAQSHYTVGRAPDAHRLARLHEALRRGEGDNAEDDDAESLAIAPLAAEPSTKSLLRLWRFAKPRIGLIVLGFVLTLVASAVGLMPQYLTIPLLDDILIPFQNKVDAAKARTDLTQQAQADLIEDVRRQEGPTFRLVSWYLAGMAGLAILAWLLGWVQGAVMAWVSERIAADLRTTTYAHIQRLSLEFFGGKRTGDLMSRISSDTDRICTFLSDNVVDFATDALMILGTAAILVAINVWLGLTTLVSFPLIGWLIYYVRKNLQHGFQKGGRAWAAMTSVLADTIPGIRVVKAFAQESREIERFRRSSDAVVEANDRVNRVWTFFWPMVVLLNQAGLLVVWAVGAWEVFEIKITVGVLTAFLGYTARFYTRLESMSRMMTATQRAAASTQRIFELLDRTSSVAEPAHPVPLKDVRGEIELRNVGFRYGTRAIISDLSFKVAPGEMIGLVGPSGAGKSTLVNLVCRFYDVTEGAILVDGIDIRQLAVEDFRRNIGLVLQEPFLFFGTVAENIAYGKPDATRAEIVAAARAARAHEFILRLADGYDSLVGERGQTLSGGERQRISIARALLIDPAILILDEATSSVDTETEREIQAALDNLIEGRTTIAIAHRLSTLRKADRLIVLERGRIAQVGQHQELLASPGVYERLHRAQQELAQGGD